MNDTNAAVMQGFRQCMASNGRVEFHSCGTGSAFGGNRSVGVGRYNGASAALQNASSYGQIFLQRMADALECPVTAGVYAQPIASGVNFRGPTVTFRPALCSQ